ncbi:ArsA-related P-loop ATPase [Streptomyces sp. BPTC-684]|uniref:ArsA family ATPase n=1 Tax=Streptomyces sp. BPTC-684 TaxID=3043734 RepID=UPI0024B18B69|nr:ArsA-related P-loop ATPase [Streptomyces sp. BPTC-684]WHM39077.1 ArsA-related P-loop ATPase [Streptomyces sp. BPTC-684]
MRTVLVTGPGGAGRTTVAAATALAAARRGERALLLSADRDEPLARLLGDEEVARLDVVRVDSGAHFRTELLALQDRAGTVLELLGAGRLDGEELTELPGAEQLALLKALREAAAGDHDLVVVDMPPVHQSVAALALPGQLRRYLRRLLPPERQAARSLRPVLAQLAGVPMPAQWLYETAARWDAELAAVEAVVEDPSTTVRLVAEPTPAAAAALRTARLGLALHGAVPDAVIANRVLPTGSADPFLAALSGQQQCVLKELAEEFAAVPLHEVPHLGRDPRGTEELDELIDGPTGEVGLWSEDGASVRPEPWHVEDRLVDDGVLVWHLPLPGATRDQLGLVRRGDELLLTVGPFRKIATLPSALRRCTVSGAGLTGGVLRIRFTPDPDLWPRTP